MDYWQLVGRHLNRFAVVMSLDERAPVGGRSKDSPANGTSASIARLMSGS